MISRPPSQFALAQKLRTEAVEAVVVVVAVRERRKARVVEGFIVDGDELDGGEILREECGVSLVDQKQMFSR